MIGEKKSLVFVYEAQNTGPWGGEREIRGFKCIESIFQKDYRRYANNSISTMIAINIYYVQGRCTHRTELEINPGLSYSKGHLRRLRMLITGISRFGKGTSR